MFFSKRAKIPENAMILKLADLDDLLTVLRYWYGIEVDHWINSEASKYFSVLKVSKFPREKHLKRLFEYFKEAIEEAKRLRNSKDPIEKEDLAKTFASFLGAEVEVLEENGKKYLLVKRLAPSCRVHHSVQNWFFFTDEKPYYKCDIKLSLIFVPFGEEDKKSTVTFDIKIFDEDQITIVGFESNGKKFDDFSFLKKGLNIFREIDLRIAQKHKEGKRPEFFNPLKPDWFLFECESEEEAVILDDINITLGNESIHKGKKVEFKMEEVDIPGLISYLRAGLPHTIYS